jgi:hypothetical protein
MKAEENLCPKRAQRIAKKHFAEATPINLPTP